MLLQIDETLIQSMSDDELSRYLPIFGDRLAVRSYFTQRDALPPTSKKKMSLVGKLQEKINMELGNTVSGGVTSSEAMKLVKENHMRAQAKQSKVEASRLTKEQANQAKEEAIRLHSRSIIDDLEAKTTSLKDAKVVDLQSLCSFFVVTIPPRTKKVAFLTLVESIDHPSCS